MILTIAIALAALSAGVLAGSLLLTALSRGVLQRGRRLTPATRADVLAAVRLLPISIGMIFSSLVTISFVRFEPAAARETIGVVLIGCAALGLAAVGRSLVRAIGVGRETERLLGAWGPALPVANEPYRAIDCAFPVVAIVGIWRPTLYIATQVLQACDVEELDAMIAHERSHIACRDNLVRLLFYAFPVPWFARDAASRIEHAWLIAAEERADDRATAGDRRALTLASALVKVGRLAAGKTMPLVHASAITSGPGIEQRVRRLLEPQPVPRGPRSASLLLPAAVLLALASALPMQRTLYDAVEFCVRHLP